MADDSLDDSTPDYGQITDQVMSHVANYVGADQLVDTLAKALLKAISGLAQGLAKAAAPIAKLGGQTLVDLEEPVLPVLAAFVAPIVANLFGTDAGQELFSSRGNREGRGGAAAGIVDAYMKALAGDADGEIEPGDEGAKRIATAGVHAALEGWFNELIPELLGEMIPIDWMHFPAFTGLSEEIIGTLGVGRLVRRAMAPLVDATAATPMKRAANVKYRPNLLAEADIIRAFNSGDYSSDDAARELAQLGYSDQRQDILLKHAMRFLSAGDSLVLIRDGQFDRDFAKGNLRASGFDEIGAENALLVEEVKHLNAIRDDSAAAIKAAYIDRRIDDGALETYLGPIYASDEDRSAYGVAWRTIRDLNTKRLTPAQAEACVKASVLPIAAYREALTLDGYTDEAVLALELLLETQLNADADVEKLRKQKLADAAAAAAAKAIADKAKQDALDAAHALARRGSLSELRRAAVLGLIPTARVREILDPQYDSDTVAAILATVEVDRAAYVAQQQKAEDAAKRATLRHVDVGQLQQAVLDNVVTLDQFRQQLDVLNFAPADADILVATTRARKTDLDAAKAKRAAADAAAKTKSIDLGRFEQLVRAGHRSLADYDSLLDSLGFDDASRAAMVDLLEVHIGEDQKARDARAAVAAKNAQQGLTLDQFRRAVILGVKTTDDFQQWLMVNKFTIDAQTVLMAELRDDVDQADAARAKRAAAAQATVDTRLPLSTVARAARLGLVSPGDYETRLRAAGYTDDDVSIELDLLAVEIADIQAKRAAADAAAAKTADRGLSLAELATAVKLGVSSIDAYRARAVALGYQPDDVDTLVAVLADEAATAQAAQARHATIDAQLAPRNLSLSELDQSVLKGLLTVDAYRARVIALGFGSDDADLLVSLLALKLPAAPQ